MSITTDEIDDIAYVLICCDKSSNPAIKQLFDKLRLLCKLVDIPQDRYKPFSDAIESNKILTDQVESIKEELERCYDDMREL